MALDPKLLDSLPNTLVDMYGLVEIDILEDMARRISTYDYFIPAALHQNQKLQELGLTQDYILQVLSGMTGQTQEELVELLTMATEEAIEDDKEYYTRADVYEPSKVETEALHAQLNSGLLQTQQAFFNITATTANTATKQFERALDRAWTQINTGAFDYNTAIKRAITDLANDGLSVIEYPSGHRDTLEVAVRRAVVTGANQTVAKTQEVLADELGVALVEVTAHGGARPEHAKWQGQVYSRKGEITIDGVTYKDFVTETGYGTGAGLGGWNCRHNFHPYVHGTARTYTDEMLKEYEAKNIEYNGKKYTEYEASQIQRRIEREIRKQKRTVAALEAGGQDASGERAKLKDAQKSYTDFTEQTGLKKQNARTQIGTAKAKRAVDKATAGVSTPEPNQNNVLTNNVNNDTITKEDIEIMRSLGSASKRHKVKLPGGSYTKTTEGTKITKVVAFAGKGLKRKVDVAEHLSKQYGGKPENWQHVRGEGFVDVGNESRRAELHWFDNEDVGIKGMKVKRWKDES